MELHCTLKIVDAGMIKSHSSTSTPPFIVIRVDGVKMKKCNCTKGKGNGKF